MHSYIYSYYCPYSLITSYCYYSIKGQIPRREVHTSCQFHGLHLGVVSHSHCFYCVAYSVTKVLQNARKCESVYNTFSGKLFDSYTIHYMHNQ